MNTMRDKIAEYGYGSPLDVDSDMRVVGVSLLRAPDVSKVVRYGNSGHIRPPVIHAMFEYYVLMGASKCIAAVAKSLLRQHGWCEKTWVRLHIWNMITVWPDAYTNSTGKPIVDIDAFWLDAWNVDNIEELYEKDY